MTLRFSRQESSASDSGRLAVMRSAGYSVGRTATIAGTPVIRDGASTAPPRNAASDSGGATWCERSPAPDGTLASNCPSPRSRVMARPALPPACAMIAASAAVGTSTTASARRPPGSIRVRAM